MKRHKENTVIMGDLNPFSFNTFDYLTPTFKFQNDPKKLDAAVRDGDVEALMWKRAPASMNANGGRTSIGGSIATGARSAAPAPRLQVGASLPPASASAHVNINCEYSSLCTEVANSKEVFGDEYVGHDEPSAVFYSNTIRAESAHVVDRNRGY